MFLWDVRQKKVKRQINTVDYTRPKSIQNYTNRDEIRH